MSLAAQRFLRPSRLPFRHFGPLARSVAAQAARGDRPCGAPPPVRYTRRSASPGAGRSGKQGIDVRAHAHCHDGDRRRAPCSARPLRLSFGIRFMATSAAAPVAFSSAAMQ